MLPCVPPQLIVGSHQPSSLSTISARQGSVAYVAARNRACAAVRWCDVGGAAARAATFTATRARYVQNRVMANHLMREPPVRGRVLLRASARPACATGKEGQNRVVATKTVYAVSPMGVDHGAQLGMNAQTACTRLLLVHRVEHRARTLATAARRSRWMYVRSVVAADR